MSSRSTGGSASFSGSRARSSSAQAQPFPFWPPELRHELEAWHATLERQAELEGELTFCRRNGERVHVVVAGAARSRRRARSPRHVLTVRDVSSSRRRERRLAELCGRDPADRAPRPRGVRGAARRRRPACDRLSASRSRVVLVELSVDGHAGAGVFGRPGGARRRRAAAGARAAPTTCSRGRATVSSHGSCRDTDAHGAVGAVARARTALASLPGVALTVGICDLESRQATRSLSAPTPTARSSTRVGRAWAGTAQYRSRSPPRSVRDRSLAGALFRHCSASRAGGSVTACSSERQAVCPSFAGTEVSPCSSGRRPGRRSVRTSPRSPSPSTSTTRPDRGAGSRRS